MDNINITPTPQGVKSMKNKKQTLGWLSLLDDEAFEAIYELKKSRGFEVLMKEFLLKKYAYLLKKNSSCDSDVLLYTNSGKEQIATNRGFMRCIESLQDLVNDLIDLEYKRRKEEVDS